MDWRSCRAEEPDEIHERVARLAVGHEGYGVPYEHGPNWGCPRPIVPLTGDKTTIETAIDSMLAYYSTGTFIPTGLVWGWHVLSPTEPFTEGVEPSDPNSTRP